MDKKLSLDETWEECLEMWRWIVEDSEGCALLSVKKTMYLISCRPEITSLTSTCFFCEYAIRKAPSDSDDICSLCPGRLVDSEFDCLSSEYSYHSHPIEFYKKLLELNKIRLENKK